MAEEKTLEQAKQALQESGKSYEEQAKFLKELKNLSDGIVSTRLRIDRLIAD